MAALCHRLCSLTKGVRPVFTAASPSHRKDANRLLEMQLAEHLISSPSRINKLHERYTGRKTRCKTMAEASTTCHGRRHFVFIDVIRVVILCSGIVNLEHRRSIWCLWLFEWKSKVDVFHCSELARWHKSQKEWDPNLKVESISSSKFFTSGQIIREI